MHNLRSPAKAANPSIETNGRIVKLLRRPKKGEKIAAIVTAFDHLYSSGQV